MTFRVGQSITARRPLIESSPPPSPEPMSFETSPANQLTEAFELYDASEYDSDHENRLTAKQEALETFSALADGCSEEATEAQFWQAICIKDFAEMDTQVESQGARFEASLQLFEKIHWRHYLYTEAQYWQGYCLYRLAEYLSILPKQQAEKLDKAISFFSRVRSSSHPYYCAARYWEGYCKWKLARVTTTTAEKNQLLKQAKSLFQLVDKQELYYHRKAKVLFQKCSGEISMPSGQSKITFYAKKRPFE